MDNISTSWLIYILLAVGVLGTAAYYSIKNRIVAARARARAASMAAHPAGKGR